MRPAVVACLLLGFLDLVAAGSSAHRSRARLQSPPAGTASGQLASKAPARPGYPAGRVGQPLRK